MEEAMSTTSKFQSPSLRGSGRFDPARSNLDRAG